MGIQVGDNFEHKSKKFLDGRTQYATLTDMKAVSDSNIPEGFEAYCVATDKWYKFLSTNSVDSSTGKWRERESGGGGASSLNELSDVTISSASNGQVLKYDGSKWANGTIPVPAASTTTPEMDGTASAGSSNNYARADHVHPTDTTLQPKTLSTPVTIDGVSKTTVESAIGAIDNKQPKTLSSAISIGGVSKTTVEDALSALNELSGDKVRHIILSNWKISDYKDEIDWCIKGQTVCVVYDLNCSGSSINFADLYPLIPYPSSGVASTDYDGHWFRYTYYSSYCDNVTSTWVETISTLCIVEDNYNNASQTKVFRRLSYKRNATGNPLVIEAWEDISASFDNAEYLAKIGEQNGVPTYDGQIMSLPVVTHFDKANLYSTTEQVIGKSVDGKPVYQKTFTGTTPSTWSASVRSDDIKIGTITSLDKIIEMKGIVGANNGSTTTTVGFNPISSTFSTIQTNATYAGLNFALITSVQNSNEIHFVANGTILQYFKSQPYWITVQYTKSTDAANSFNYASENDYSTSEKIVGTWIDGSTLYQKSFTGTTGTTTGSVKTIGTITSTYKIKSCVGGVDLGSNIYSSMNYCTSDSGNYCTCFVSNGSVNIITGNSDWQSKSCWVTVQYTKS